MYGARTVDADGGRTPGQVWRATAHADLVATGAVHPVDGELRRGRGGGDQGGQREGV